MTNEQIEELKKLAEAASPGPWRGDRVDGTVKYHLIDANGAPVISGDNGFDGYGIVNYKDEKYLMAANPAAIKELLSELSTIRAVAEASMCSECKGARIVLEGGEPGGCDSCGATGKSGACGACVVNETRAAASAPKAELTDEQIVALGASFGIGPDGAKKFARAVLALAAPVAAVPSDERQGLERAAKYLEKQAEDYLSEHARTEDDTGATVFQFGEAGRDYYNTLAELAEEIRALAPATVCTVLPTGWSCTRAAGHDGPCAAIPAAPAAPVAAAVPAGWVSVAAQDVLAERRRQVEAEGWTPEQDDEYEDGQLSMAAAMYAMQGDTPNLGAPGDWPWDENWWKPSSDRRNLVKAAALILADIERIDRATTQTESEKP